MLQIRKYSSDLVFSVMIIILLLSPLLKFVWLTLIARLQGVSIIGVMSLKYNLVFELPAILVLLVLTFCIRDEKIRKNALPVLVMYISLVIIHSGILFFQLP